MAQPIIIYHRGRHGEDIGVDEGTLPALEYAVREGARIVEFDLRFHQPSGEIFIIHDPWLNRTTNWNGKLSDHSLEELRSFRTKHGSHLPTFDEAIETIGGRCQINLDIKSPRAALVAARKIEKMYKKL